MPRLWRIVKRRHVSTAFDGAAARRYGGRWNSPGRAAVYASGSKSLALLEILVHLDVGGRLPRFAAFSFDVADAEIEILDGRFLPRAWRSAAGLQATQRIGDTWIDARTSIALAVPSAIVPEERNYLLNPEHPRFRNLRIGRPLPLVLDPRLVD